TPSGQRSAIRKSTTILLTNPDMLHQGILPHHTNWARFFAKLRYVVIDEMHLYRGVFGSHFANLVRRLKRVCAFYNAYPQFVLTSATIGNPEELATNLIEQKIHLIEHDGSPRGPAHFLVYNPPFVDEKLGIRKSSIDFGVIFTQKLMKYEHQSLVFARTRRTVEMLLTYLRNRLPFNERENVRGYRSGYLKSERREIEQGLKAGTLKAVFSTSALELGVDIGDLDAVILVGFPGTIATARQRIGRAGRKQQPSLGILIVTNEAMDQYLATHPEYLVDQNPEQALIDAQNLVILLQHIGCAAFELPFSSTENFGSMTAEELAQFLDLLEQSGSITRQGEEYYWLADRYPAAEVSLRSSTPNVVSLNVVGDSDETKFIGSVDANAARWYVHKDAIYLHDAEMYEVLELNLENGVCLLKPSQSEYYTIPVIDTRIIDYKLTSSVPYQNFTANYGSLDLEISITTFQKKRWMSNELLGVGQIDLPPQNLHTTGFWLGISPSLIDTLRKNHLWGSDPNIYGAGWDKLRQKILLRDGYTCRSCGKVFPVTELHVHHVQPFRTFAEPALANQASNLVTLCASCHHKAEISVMVRSGLAAAAYSLRSIAPLLIMCDREDISLLSENRSILNDANPAILVYDNIPGGIGLSRKLYDLRNSWIERAIEVIQSCPCQSGCPACVGPVGEPGYGGKSEALALLKGLRYG
ncbi:MAG: DUF1998 domain-containing protein, partial [Anaerolineaceae bacterium]|nr:DUF1998 domain-containing protein [Anaerolineaceae bacterium]